MSDSSTTDVITDVAKDAVAASPLGPIGMALGGAAGLIAHYGPSLMRALFGSSPAAAAPVAVQAAAAVARITGTADPKEQLARVHADPNMALELQVQLGNLAVSMEEQRAQEARDAAAAALAARTEADASAARDMEISSSASQASLAAGLRDTQSARKMGEAYLAAGKTDERANIMVVGAAVGLVACIAAGITLAFVIKTDTQANGLIIGLVVSVAGAFGSCLQQAYGFEFGNSRSGRNQSDQLSAVANRLMEHSAQSVPISALAQLGGSAPAAAAPPFAPAAGQR